MRGVTIARIAEALRHDVETGVLAADTPVAALAAFVGATLQGMSGTARDGASTEELHAIAALALKALPVPAEPPGPA
jgi:hypothetical protein